MSAQVRFIWGRNSTKFSSFRALNETSICGKNDKTFDDYTQESLTNDVQHQPSQNLKQYQTTPYIDIVTK